MHTSLSRWAFHFKFFASEYMARPATTAQAAGATGVVVRARLAGRASELAKPIAPIKGSSFIGFLLSLLIGI
jgi:hypothetical protein